MSCGVGCKHGSDPVLLWLWCRLLAPAPIRPLAWEPPYAVGVALKRQKDKKKEKKKGKEKRCPQNLFVFSRGYFFVLISSLEGMYSQNENLLLKKSPEILTRVHVPSREIGVFVIHYGNRIIFLTYGFPPFRRSLKLFV